MLGSTGFMDARCYPRCAIGLISAPVHSSQHAHINHTPRKNYRLSVVIDFITLNPPTWCIFHSRVFFLITFNWTFAFALRPQNTSKRDLLSAAAAASEEAAAKVPVLQDKDFVLDCLCWHNEYRARHSAQALIVSPGVSTNSCNPDSRTKAVHINCTHAIPECFLYAVRSHVCAWMPHFVFFCGGTMYDTIFTRH